jgi:hypothetical protein
LLKDVRAPERLFDAIRVVVAAGEALIVRSG